MTPASTPPEALQGRVVVALADFFPRHIPWAWLRLARGAAGIGPVPGLRFAKVMGSGRGGGFGLAPSATHQGLIALLDSPDSARNFMDGPVLAAMRERSRRFWVGLMAVDSARGAWDGQAWSPEVLAADADTQAPAGLPPRAAHPGAPGAATSHRQALAVITRASIRPSRAWPFWRHAPASHAALKSAPGCLLAMGLGEAPLLRQCTFSLWRNASAMQAFAQGGAHGQAAQAAWRQDFFSESMFVRLRLLAHDGHWPHPEAGA